MPERIHLVHLSAGAGGMELLLPVLVENMPARPFSSFVIRRNHIGDGVYKNVRIPIEYGSNRNIAAYIKTLLYTIKNRRAVFHVFNIGPVFLFLMRLGGAKNIIYSIHGTIYWTNGIERWIYRLLWQIALRGKITLLANSVHSRNEFLKKIDSRAKIRVLYNPIDLSRFSVNGSISKNEEIVIIYSGRLEKGKNLQKWIEIASYVHSFMPKTRFEIYGDGSLRSLLRQQIAALNADDFIKMKGFRNDIESAYRKADAFLFLSEYESFGNVVVESILCGTPVIASPIPVMKEIFHDYPQFVLNEKEDLKVQVLNKLQQLDELRTLTACAREKFAIRFSANRHIESLQNIYSGCEQ